MAEQVKKGLAMVRRRYWTLFWLAVCLGLHALVVGKLLGSIFFVMVFFWGWVAVHALRGQLDAAQAMVITMCVLLFGTAGLMIAYPQYFEHELAYYTFALYPAMVSWTCTYFYIRHLRAGARADTFKSGHKPQVRSAPSYATYGTPHLTAP